MDGRPLAPPRPQPLLVREPVVVALILLNAVALVVLGFIDEQSRAGRLWASIDYACGVLFVIEAILKISHDPRGFRGYWAEGWNRFDFLIVLASSPALLSPVMDASALSGILVLRLGRLFRLFRLLRFIPERDRVAAGIVRALKASVAVFLAVVLVNFIFAMGAFMLFERFADDFANPLVACYSMFQVFTVEGWYEIPAAIAEGARDLGASPLWALLGRLYFVVAVLTGGILGLSLANAVFVDQLIMDNNDTLESRGDALTAEIRALRAELRDRGGGGGAHHEPPPG